MILPRLEFRDAMNHWHERDKAAAAREQLARLQAIVKAVLDKREMMPKKKPKKKPKFRRRAD